MPERQAIALPDVAPPKKKSKLATDLMCAKASPEQYAIMQAKIITECQRILNRENPHTRKHRIETLKYWSTIVWERYPTRSGAELWETPIIKDCAHYFLRF